MDPKRIAVFAKPGSGTGRLLAQLAEEHGHHARRFGEPSAAAALERCEAIVLVPHGGDPERHAHGAMRILVAAARHDVHLLLVSSFGVGYGAAHPFNRAMGLLPGMASAERVLRASGLPYTIVRPTWLTDDPPGAHAVVLTQDPHADGMLARADLAATLVAAIERPAARDTTFAAFNEPGAGTRHWTRAFAALAPDRERRVA